MDKVFITGLELYTLIGVYDFERLAKQRVLVDLELQTSLSSAGKSDDVVDTLDYGAIAKRVEDIANQSSYHLLEAFAAEILRVLQQEFSPKSVLLRIHKPDILDNVKSVGIELYREF